MIDDRALRRVLSPDAVALLGDLIRATSWMLVLVGLVLYAGIYLHLAGLLLATPGGNDFTIFYYTGRMVGEGRPMYGDLPRTYGLVWKGAHLGNLNPPHFQLLLAPLVPWGYRTALLAWLCGNVFLVGFTAWLAIRELRPRLTLKSVLLTSLLVFGSAAWTSVAVTGEMSLLLLLPFTGAWIAARRGRWATTGVLLGICLSLKLFMFVFFAWLLVGRRWRAVGGMMVGLGACITAGAAAYGWTTYVEWLQGLSRVAWYWLPMNVSVRGLSERVFRPGAPFASVVHAPDLAIPVGLALAIVIAVVTAWRTWPWQRARTDVDRAFAVLLVAALLVSPLGWIYYLPLATAPLLSLAMRRTLSIPGLAGTALVVIALGLLYLPLEVTAKGQPSALATLVLASAHGWGAILLWITLVARPSTERAPELAE